MVKIGIMTADTEKIKYIIPYEENEKGEMIFLDKWYTEKEWKQLKRKEKLKKINENE
jgi:hypothetical protein